MITTHNLLNKGLLALPPATLSILVCQGREEMYIRKKCTKMMKNFENTLTDRCQGPDSTIYFHVWNPYLHIKHLLCLLKHHILPWDVSWFKLNSRGNVSCKHIYTYIMHTKIKYHRKTNSHELEQNVPHNMHGKIDTQAQWGRLDNNNRQANVPLRY